MYSATQSCDNFFIKFLLTPFCFDSAAGSFPAAFFIPHTKKALRYKTQGFSGLVSLLAPGTS
jgi:hypothetical protein